MSLTLSIFLIPVGPTRSLRLARRGWYHAARSAGTSWKGKQHRLDDGFPHVVVATWYQMGTLHRRLICCETLLALAAPTGLSRSFRLPRCSSNRFRAPRWTGTSVQPKGTPKVATTIVRKATAGMVPAYRALTWDRFAFVSLCSTDMIRLYQSSAPHATSSDAVGLKQSSSEAPAGKL